MTRQKFCAKNNHMKKILIGNWKMNPTTRLAAVKLAKKVDSPGLVIAPPFVFLESVGKVLKRATLGAQDVFWNAAQKGGAATGEISHTMLKNLGVRYVIIGHSERRHMMGETDAMVNRKTKEALSAGFFTVVCIGEPASVRKRGVHASMQYVRAQIKKNFDGTSRMKNVKKKLTVAYEPIWAIGTGTPATSRYTNEMVSFIKRMLKVQGLRLKVLYGGSVNARNIRNFLF